VKGYLIANLDVHDQPAFDAYREQVLPLIARFGGRNLVRGSDLVVLEGELPLDSLVILEFPNLQSAQAFYDSPDYQPLKDLRLQCAVSDVLLVEGVQGPPAELPVGPAFLDAFAAAWNRHDTDAILAMMTDDCVFEASRGPEAKGTVYVGRDEVRRGIQEVFAAFPDAAWTEPRHFIAGDRGVSEWTFTATAPDGTRIAVEGCDVFTFRNGLIAVKNSYRKQRI
jgi:uncharacterized protein (DUF1330 family)/ketosteroid isomerase-like protein